ncbi:hypothetical protein [Pedobacter frigoris]|uniref:hypothetical protein n=1 Tax=Pedobacter frigoris TaxID=2571272 RepID=UPI00292E4008|nr:hypothetical protein [Pedobacter frigoris]
MQSLKKAFRILCLSVLILLASFGVGLSGGIVMPASRKREDNPVLIELVETNKENKDGELKEADQV